MILLQWMHFYTFKYLLSTPINAACFFDYHVHCEMVKVTFMEIYIVNFYSCNIFLII